MNTIRPIFFNKPNQGFTYSERGILNSALRVLLEEYDFYADRDGYHEAAKKYREKLAAIYTKNSSVGSLVDAVRS